MANISSYGNEDVFRELNLINFTMPTATYYTPYVDISKYKYFNLVASTDTTPLAITAHHSVNASGDTTKEIAEVLTSVVPINALTDVGVVTVKTRFIRFQLTQAIGSIITFQAVFRKASLGLSNLTNVGAGVPLYTAPSSIKTLTSNDGSIIITDNGTEVDLSDGNTGMVTVGTSGADYLTINDAVVASNCNIRVITDVVETQQTTVTTCGHLRLELVPGITLSNTIAAAGDWFIGDNNLLKIEGAGAHMDLTTVGLSSQIVLQNNQTFHWGTDAELDVSGVRFTGVGFNVLLSGSSRVRDCRFDGATRFTFDSFERNLFIDGCYFTVPITLDSLTGAEPKSLIVSNNIFDDGADIIISGVDNLVFNGNTVGKTAATSMDISGTSCSNVVISNNNFEFSELTISSTTLTNTNISDNVWARISVDGMTLSSTCDNLIVSNNVVHHITVNNTLTESVVSGNTLKGAVTVTGLMTNSKISENCAAIGLILGALLTSVIADNLALNITIGSTTSNCTISENSVNTAITFTGNVLNTPITSNRADILTFLADLNSSQIVGNSLVSGVSNSLSVTGLTADTVISSNVGDFGWLFLGNIFRTIISNNKLTDGPLTLSGIFTESEMVSNTFGTVNFTGAVSADSISCNTFFNVFFLSTVTDSAISNNYFFGSAIFSLTTVDMTFNGNTMIGNLSITGAATRCAINGNTIGISILIDVINGANSTHNTICGNICPTSILVGAAVGGIVGNVINGNVALVSIVVVSNVTDNICTSNRTPVGAIAGFGGADVVANNV